MGLFPYRQPRGGVIRVVLRRQEHAEMRFWATQMAAWLLLAACVATSAAHASSAKVEAHFRGDCEKAICQQIQSAKKTILVAAFSLTSNYVVDALSDASKRGVDVRMKIDRKQSRMEAAEKLVNRLRTSKISVVTISMPEYYSMHNKFLVIDNDTVLTGSFNFTVAAARENWENIVVIESVPVASAFKREWRSIKTKK